MRLVLCNASHVMYMCKSLSPKIDIYDARISEGDIQTLLNVTAEGTQVYSVMLNWEHSDSLKLAVLIGHYI